MWKILGYDSHQKKGSTDSMFSMLISLICLLPQGKLQKNKTSGAIDPVFEE